MLIDGWDVSGDVSALNSFGTPTGTQQVNGIDALAMARIGLLHDATLEASVYWNPSSGGAGTSLHEVLRGLPFGDRQATYLCGQTAGAPAVSMVSKQVNYDWNRAADGSLAGSTTIASNAYGASWGVQLTAGKRTDTVAGNGPTVDLGAVPISYSFGWVAHLHVMAFTGTSVTVKIQDSADGSAWADLAGGGFVAATAIGAQRLFAFGHLPEGKLRNTSGQCASLAEEMVRTLPDGPELSSGLRKLLEAKDCFVRAAVLE
jgi:hypothetical protein